MKEHEINRAELKEGVRGLQEYKVHRVQKVKSIWHVHLPLLLLLMSALRLEFPPSLSSTWRNRARKGCSYGINFRSVIQRERKISKSHISIYLRSANATSVIFDCRTWSDVGADCSNHLFQGVIERRGRRRLIERI